ncbi:DNA polymerase III subunit delta [Streptococcus cameli]
MLAIEAVKKLNKNNLGLLTVLSGEDTGQYQLAKEALLKTLGFDASDLSFAYFDLSESSFAQFELELVSLPFFADEKIVIADYVSDLSTDKKRYFSDGELKQFEAYLEAPNETTRLILLVPGKLDNKRRLVKMLKRDALCIEATEAKEAEIRTYFQQEIRKKNMEMGEDVLEQLLVKSGFDISEMTKNIAFLKAYKPKGSITSEDIREAIPKTLQDNLFDLSTYILGKKVDQAQDLVKDLRLQGEDDVKLIAILLTQFRMFLQVQLLSQKGRAESQIVTELSDYLGRKVNPYQVKFALRDSRGLSLSFLKETVANLIETDYKIKSGQMEKEYLFDICLLKMMNALS